MEIGTRVIEGLDELTEENNSWEALCKATLNLLEQITASTITAEAAITENNKIVAAETLLTKSRDERYDRINITAQLTFPLPEV